MGYLSCKAGSAVAIAVTSAASTSGSIANKSSPPESPSEDRPRLRRFLHRDLEAATGGFDINNLLGRGSHGSVYKAVIGSRHVAVKRPSKSREISREFHNEFEILSRIRSPRFVNLLGYSADNSKDPLLVVEFMGNGSLYDVIHSDSALNSGAMSSWGKRIKIALQIAKAVHLLHSQDPPIMHRDIKSANVLMDKNLNAKLGDFGLAIRCNVNDQKVKSTPPAGTMGYLDPDYVTADRLSTKTDVFSFGILLLEIISGRKAIDVRYSPSFIVDWAIPMIKRGKIGGIYDPRIGPPMDVSVRNHLGLVAAKCVRTCREKRPGMEEVVGWLTGLTKSVRSRRWDDLGIGNPCMMVETFPPVKACNEAETRAKKEMGKTETGGESSARKIRRRVPTSIESLDADILCIIFSFLDLFDLVHCTVVCNSWYAVIKRLKLLQASCRKMHQLGSTSLEHSAEIDVEDFAMKHHKMALLRGRIEIERWEAHSHRVSQCRMKKGLLLTGVGDKVMRLWSLNSFKCMEEYSLPDAASLIDFDFDESKIVGLVGTRISIWRRNGQRSVFPSREGTFPKGLCMRYIDPEAVVGCEDGTARVFDMYSKTCSQIVRTHGGPVTCLSLGDNQLFVSGSSLGRVTVSDPLLDQPVATLKSTISAGGIQTICFNQGTNLAFTGTTGGYVSCWDLRKMGRLWEHRVSPNVVYSIQQLRNDTSAIVAGGIDGVVRVIDQKNGRVLTRFIMDDKVSTTLRRNSQVVVEKRRGKRVSQDIEIDKIERKTRPQISCLAVGMKKIVTAHSGKFISVWKLNLS